MSSWVDISIAAGAITTVAGAVGGLAARHLARTIGHSVQAKVDTAAREILGKVDFVRDDVIKIRATVFPNGGSSLADQVTKARDAALRAESAAKSVSTRMDDHLLQAEDDRRRIEALESRK